MTNIPTPELSRRDVLATGVAAAVVVPAVSQAAASAPASAVSPVVPVMDVSIRINGVDRHLSLDPRTTLLDALREHLHLTGTKKGCDHGQCGACTVISDGRRINSCLSLAVMHEGGEVTTIEGLGTPEHLHPLQAAFIRHDGFQCGYCTPGQICSAVATLDEIRRNVPSYVTADLTAPCAVSAGELRERLAGNLCRCGAYSNIIAAIEDHAAGGSPA